MPIEVVTPVEIPFWVEVAAIVAGAVAGSLRAIREQLAVSGVVALAVALGLGGGLIRDTLIQAGTPVAFTSSWFLPIAVLASVPVLIGVLAGTGGSVLADLAVGVPPVLFRPGLLLGVASAIGTSIYVAGSYLTDHRGLFFLLGVLVVAVLRVVSIFTGWGVGSAHELSARSEAMLGRRPNWVELQRQGGGSLLRRNRDDD